MSAAEPNPPVAAAAAAELALSVQQHLAKVSADATRLAETLRDASDAGVPHALILPQLVLVFREAFGEMPAGFKLPGLG